MGFRLTFDKLSDTDKNLTNKAIHEVRSNSRPNNIHIDTIHEGETVAWSHCLPEALIAPEVNQYLAAEMFLMTRDGFLYFLPILLSLGLFESLSDFEYNFVSKFRREVLDTQLECSFSTNSKSLSERWIEINLSHFQESEMDATEFDSEVPTHFARLMSVLNHILNSPTKH